MLCSVSKTKARVLSFFRVFFFFSFVRSFSSVKTMDILFLESTFIQIKFTYEYLSIFSLLKCFLFFKILVCTPAHVFFSAYLTTFRLSTRMLLFVQPGSSTQILSEHTSQHTNSIFTGMWESVWYQTLSLRVMPNHNTVLSHCSNLPALTLFLIWPA